MAEDFGDGGYQRRRELRRACQTWLGKTEADLFVTLSLAQNVGLNQARQALGRWLAFVDNHYIGRGWARRPSRDRTQAFIFPENISTNLHYHALMRLPARGQLQSLSARAATLERLWRKIERRGTCQVEWIQDSGAARYVTKQLVRPGYWEHFILASEFHAAGR
jgi:hypothetical protein